jgi:hypothetical protein
MYTKLYSTILDSSIWSSSDSTRIVWITMLAMATKNGIVHASVDGLARRANKDIASVRAALEELAAPDPNDKSGVREGRRIEPMQGCWQIVNFEFYRETRSIDAVRKQQWRTRKVNVLDNAPRSAPAPAPAPAEIRDPDPPDPPLLPVVLRTIPEGYVPSEELLASAEMSGCSRAVFAAKLAELGDGPIGGSRGVLPHKLESYLLKCSAKWRTWAQTDAAKAPTKPRTRTAAEALKDFR